VLNHPGLLRPPTTEPRRAVSPWCSSRMASVDHAPEHSGSADRSSSGEEQDWAEYLASSVSRRMEVSPGFSDHQALERCGIARAICRRDSSSLNDRFRRTLGPMADEMGRTDRANSPLMPVGRIRGREATIVRDRERRVVWDRRPSKTVCHTAMPRPDGIRHRSIGDPATGVAHRRQPLICEVCGEPSDGSSLRDPGNHAIVATDAYQVRRAHVDAMTVDRSVRSAVSRLRSQTSCGRCQITKTEDVIAAVIVPRNNPWVIPEESRCVGLTKTPAIGRSILSECG
jgi:hypothetical protein